MRATSVVFAVIGLAALVGCGATGEPDVVLARKLSPIAGGQFDSEHLGVVGMILQQGSQTELCTGSLLAPNLVLTARHCVSAVPSGPIICGQSLFGAPRPAANMHFTSDSPLAQDSRWFTGREVRVPPQGNDVCGFDVALVILEGAGFPASASTPHTPRLDTEPAAGEEYQAVGYGSTNGSGAAGSRRIRTGLSVRCGPGSCGARASSTEFVGETGTCEGDSGGPALDLRDRVIGVVSRGSAQCDAPIYGAVSAWKSWIVSAAIDAADLGGYPPPSWASGGAGGSAGSGGGANGTGGASSGGTGSGGTAGAGGAGAEGGGSSGGVSGGGGSAGDAQGDSCAADQPCPGGYQCVIDPSAPDIQQCTRTCDADRACREGFTCALDIGVCLVQNAARGSSEEAGSCSIAAGSGSRPKPLPWIAYALLVALGLGARRALARDRSRARLLALLAALAAGAGVVTACGDGDSDANTRPGGTGGAKQRDAAAGSSGSGGSAAGSSGSGGTLGGSSGSGGRTDSGPGGSAGAAGGAGAGGATPDSGGDSGGWSCTEAAGALCYCTADGAGGSSRCMLAWTCCFSASGASRPSCECIDLIEAECTALIASEPRLMRVIQCPP